MRSLIEKIFIIILIFLGEALAIYAEILGAKQYSLNKSFLINIFLKMFLLMILGGDLLILGYVFGFNIFKNIWTVSIISITSILIIELIINYVIFEQLPTRDVLVGLILGILGFIANLIL